MKTFVTRISSKSYFTTPMAGDVFLVPDHADEYLAVSGVGAKHNEWNGLAMNTLTQETVQLPVGQYTIVGVLGSFV